MMDFGDPRLPSTFWDRCIPEPNSGCWLWLGQISNKGYALFNRGIGKRNAHRFAYETTIAPVARPLVLDHLCRIRCCVNPAHLEPVTNRENILRGVGPSAKGALATHCPVGHPYDATNTKFNRYGERGCHQCARASVRAHRARLAERFLCVNGESHGPATHGRLCLFCRIRHRRNGAEQRRRAREGGAS